MWSRIPLVRLIIPYILGIILSESCNTAFIMPTHAIYILGFAVLIGGYLYGILFSYSRRWVYGFFIIIFMIFYGYFLTEKRALDGKDKLLEISSDTSSYIGIIEETFEQRERSCRGVLKLIALKDSSGCRNIELNLMLYTEPDSILAQLEAGTIMILNAGLRPLSPPANPGEFDYKKYLYRNGIYHSTYLKAGQWHICSKESGFNLLYYASRLRTHLLEKLNENGISDSQFGVSAALLLGDDSHLGDEIREIYARAGAMHILCVSGLHVGVIFLVLSLLLGFLKHFRYGRAILPLLLIFSIWSYAMITGLAPPVIRASCMISFIIAGNALGRQKNVYNTLAAAALLMLILEPYALFGAGFQLSYAAVLGIVFIQKPLYNIFYFKYSFPDKIWAITAVSIAAQLGTMPVVIYYFHQFPLYSLITNLIVIPISSLIIYSGLLLFFLPSLSYAAYAAAWALSSLISIMDVGVLFVEDLPYSALTDISIDFIMVIFLFLIIICMSLFFIKRINIYLFMGLTLALFFTCYRSYIHYGIEKQQHFVVYAVKGHSAYDIIQGRTHTFVIDSGLYAIDSKINYSIKPNWLSQGLDKPDIILLPSAETINMAYGTCKMLNVTCSKVVVWQGSYLPAFLLKIS